MGSELDLTDKTFDLPEISRHSASLFSGPHPLTSRVAEGLRLHFVEIQFPDVALKFLARPIIGRYQVMEKDVGISHIESVRPFRNSVIVRHLRYHGAMETQSGDEQEIRALIDKWSKAVRDQNLAGIRADHDPEMLMFDVPPPFQSRGLDAYMATWDEFIAMQAKPIRFDFRDIAITAGTDVAFATAIGTCCDLSSGAPVNLDFRLTMGLKKVDGKWRIMHEHHSIPAAS